MIKKNSIQNINQYIVGSDQVVYEDLQVSLSTARLPAANAPTWRTYNYGVGGGVTFAALGFAINDYVDFFVQTKHSMKLNTALDIHIHYTIPSDSADDNIKFQLDTVAAAIGSDYAVPSGSPYSSEHTLVGDEAGHHSYLDVCDITAFNSTVSSLAICRLTRVAASADDYANEVYITYIDGHYQSDTAGSRQEATK